VPPRGSPSGAGLRDLRLTYSCSSGQSADVLSVLSGGGQEVGNLAIVALDTLDQIANSGVEGFAFDAERFEPLVDVH
jgi:hypothetical protein